MAHIVAARWLWLSRFHGAQFVPVGFAPQTVADFFPDNISFTEVSTRVAEMHACWARYLAGLPEDELSRVFVYQCLEGPRFQNTFAYILIQLFGHSWYHCGSIAL